MRQPLCVGKRIQRPFAHSIRKFPRLLSENQSGLRLLRQHAGETGKLLRVSDSWTLLVGGASPREDVTVTGTASDTDGTVTSQAWSQISGDPIVLSDDTAGLGSFTAPDVVEITDLEFAFTATDDDGFEGGRVVTITVLPSNLLRAQLGLLTGADVIAVRTTNTTEIL